MFAQRQGRVRPARREAARRPVPLRNILDPMYMISRQHTDQASVLLMDGQIFSLPIREEIREALIQLRMANQNARVELHGRQEQIVAAEVQRGLVFNIGKSSYSNKFLYEVVHYLYYLRHRRYLPYIGTTPDKAYIMTLLYVYDPRDILQLRRTYDFDDELNEMAVTYLEYGPNLPVNHQEGREDLFNDLARGVIRSMRSVSTVHPNLIHNAIKKMMASFSRIPMITAETDFTIIRCYEELLKVIRENEQNREIIGFGVGRNLIVEGINELATKALDLSATMLSKTFNFTPLIEGEESTIFLTAFPEKYNILKSCLSMNGGEEFFHGGAIYDTDAFISENFREDYMNISFALGLTPELNLLRRIAEMRLPIDEILGSLGVDLAGLNDYINRLLFAHGFIERPDDILEEAQRVINLTTPGNLLDLPAGMKAEHFYRACFMVHTLDRMAFENIVFDHVDPPARQRENRPPAQQPNQPAQQQANQPPAQQPNPPAQQQARVPEDMAQYLFREEQAQAPIARANNPEQIVPEPAGAMNLEDDVWGDGFEFLRNIL